MTDGLAPRLRSSVVLFIALVIATAVYVPIAPQQLEQEPDLSFRATTHDAFARRLQLGREIVSTYGPWGILQRGFDRRTDSFVLVVSSLLAAAFAWGVVRVGYAAGGGGAPALIGTLTAASLIVAGGHDARFTALALLLMLSALEPFAPARELPLAASLGIVALIKLPLLMIAIFAVLMTAVVRRRVVHIAAFLGVLFIAWLVAGQHLAGLWLFVRLGRELAAGYSEVQSTGSGMPIAVIGAAGLVAVVAVIERSWSRTLMLAGAVAYLLKIGFVRADQVHASAANALLLLLATGYLFIRRDAVPRMRRVAVTATAIAALVAMIAGAPMLTERLQATAMSLGERSSITARLEREMFERSGAGTLPRVEGAIDAYPWGSAALISRGLNYSPRPVFESYLAWTIELAQLNADHLRGPRAPEWIWASVGSIDVRLPLLDDAPSWLEMLRRYEIAGWSPDHLLLHKRALPKSQAIQPLLAITARFGEEVTIPSDAGMLWASIELHPAIGARIRDAIKRPNPLGLETTTVDGVTTWWRIVPALVGGGFLISPEVSNTSDLRSLFAGDRGRRVARVRLTGRAPGETFVLRLGRVAM